MFQPKGAICQSCGMPLARDPRGGGTNADGSVNPDYCSNCFHAGAFLEPKLTVADMQQKVRHEVKEMHLPGFMATKFVKQIPTLKRWRDATAGEPPAT